MIFHEEIERVLLNEIDRTKAEYQRAAERLPIVRKGRLPNAREVALNTAMDAYALALKEFSTFCLDGECPKRLQGSRGVQSKIRTLVSGPHFRVEDRIRGRART